MNNYLKMEISALGENGTFVRNAVSAFALPLNPTLSELSDVKTAVSEAITNSIVHGYKNAKRVEDKIVIECQIEGDEQGGFLHIRVVDYGCGIADTQKAIEPFFTTLENEEHSGMGFTVMQTFTDEFSLESSVGEGTVVCMRKIIGKKANGNVGRKNDD